MKITKLLKILTLSSLVVFFTSCSSIPLPLEVDYRATNYDALIENALQKASAKLAKLHKSREVVLVTDFVNVDNLENKSKLGFLLSSTLKDKLTSSHGLTVREVELSQNFKMGAQGLKLLTREHKEIDPNLYDENYAVVGTYALTSRQLIVFIKIIDIYTGHVLATTSNKARMTKEMKELDRSPRKGPRIYSPTVL